MKVRTTLAISTTLLSLVACGGSHDDLSDADPAGGDPGFSRTVVRFAEDGSSTVTVSPTGGTEHGAGLTPQAIRRDSACSGSDLRLFDQANGGGNEICFVGGTGNAWLDLGAYCRILVTNGPLTPPTCLATWAAATRSYYAGYQSGNFSDFRIPVSCSESFEPHTAHPQAGACAASSRHFILYYIGLRSP